MKLIFITKTQIRLEIEAEVNSKMAYFSDLNKFEPRPLHGYRRGQDASLFKGFFSLLLR